MKKIFILLLVCLTVFTGCSSDDSNEDINSSNFLIGKWVSKEDYFGDQVDYEIDGEFVHTYTSSKVTSEQNGEFRATYEYSFDPESMELLFGEETIYIEKINNDEFIGHNGLEGENYRGTLFQRIE